MTSRSQKHHGKRRVLAGVTATPCNAPGMAQPHKGNRTLIAARPAQDVYEEVRRRAAALGISISQYASDVLAEHIGRPDLVRELNRDREEGLPLAM